MTLGQRGKYVPLYAVPAVALFVSGTADLPGRSVLLFTFVAFLLSMVLYTYMKSLAPGLSARAMTTYKPKVCPNCQYDLRATPERCPECGWQPPPRPLFWTPALNRVSALAEQIARERRADYIGSEHVLLGILREGDNTAALLLTNCGIDENDVAERTDAMLLQPPLARVASPADADAANRVISSPPVE